MSTSNLLQKFQDRQHESLMTMAVDRDKNTINITDVKSGLQSDAFCVVCNSQLIAKKGDIKTHHFAHINGTECKYWKETFIHLAVKRYFTEVNEFILPAYYVDKELVQSRFAFKFTECIVENRLGSIVPDICLVASNGTKLIVEVAVTHFCDERKIQKIRELDISCIEIDFSAFKYYRSIIYSDIENHIKSMAAVWIFNKKITPIHDKIIYARHAIDKMQNDLIKLNSTILNWADREGRYDEEWTKSVRVLPDNDLYRYDASICQIDKVRCNGCKYASSIDKGKAYWYVSCAYSEDDDYLTFVADTTKEKQKVVNEVTETIKLISDTRALVNDYIQQIRDLRLKTTDIISVLKFIN